jgi:uncharacterized membrane protein YkvA (DUF1232 family)
MTDERISPSESTIAREISKRKSRAEDYLNDPDKSKSLFDQAVKKAKNKEENKGPLADVWNSLKALLRMFQAYMRREYTKVPWGSIVLVVIAIIYFVSPLDLVPDWLPLAGFVDDAAVIGFVIKAIQNDLNAFLKWEQLKNSINKVIDVETSK